MKDKAQGARRKAQGRKDGREMIKREETPIVIKSKALALEIIKLCNFLKEKKHEYSLSDQMIRSGTSVGANIREAIHGVSDNDMYNKFNIALKEASETEYWLEILSESGYLEPKQIETAYSLNRECIKMLISITAKQKKL